MSKQIGIWNGIRIVKILYTVACWYMNKKPETLADNYIDDINSTPIADYEVLQQKNLYRLSESRSGPETFNIIII